MDHTLIIGYGNPLRGDDALGPLAAERLRAVVTDPAVEILALHQLTPELADPISRASRVVFIDASAAGEAGEIHERAIRAGAPSGTSFTHHATPEGLLAAALALYGRAPEAVLISVPGSDFAFSMEPSPELQKCVESVVAAVLRKLG